MTPQSPAPLLLGRTGLLTTFAFALLVLPLAACPRAEAAPGPKQTKRSVKEQAEAIYRRAEGHRKAAAKENERFLLGERLIHIPGDAVPFLQ